MTALVDATVVNVETSPPSWSFGMLSEYIERPQYGYTDSASNDASGTKFLRITDIQNGQVDWSSVPYCHCPLDVLASKRLLPGDVVVARIGATTGKSFFIDSTPDDAVFASYLIRLRAKQGKLLPRFLYFCMQTAEYWAHIDLHKGDRLKGGVNIAVLESMPVIIPPISEQARIVRVLDFVESRVRLERRALTVALELKQAAMSTLFTNGRRGEALQETDIGPAPENWHIAPIGANFSVVSGGTPSRGNPAYWTAGTIPWVKTTEVDYCVITETTEHITPEGLANSAAKLLPPGTVLMAMYGQGVTRGRVAMLGIEASCNQACAALNSTGDTLLPRYLYHFLCWRYEAIRSLAHGGQQQNLNLDIVREIPTVYPPDVEEQQEIVDVLDALDISVELHRRREAVLDEMIHSLRIRLLSNEISVDDLDLSALPEQAVEPEEMLT